MIEPLDVAMAAVVLGILSTMVIKVSNIFASRSRGGADPAQLQRLEERLGRIEQAIDAMSIEVERISEGQRFTTKLLAERAKESA